MDGEVEFHKPLLLSPCYLQRSSRTLPVPFESWAAFSRISPPPDFTQSMLFFECSSAWGVKGSVEIERAGYVPRGAGREPPGSHNPLGRSIARDRRCRFSSRTRLPQFTLKRRTWNLERGELKPLLTGIASVADPGLDSAGPGSDFRSSARTALGPLSRTDSWHCPDCTDCRSDCMDSLCSFDE